MPGALKNAIDWVSRYQPQPLNERHGLLMSASPSMAGANRGLWASTPNQRWTESSNPRRRHG